MDAPGGSAALSVINKSGFAPLHEAVMLDATTAVSTPSTKELELILANKSVDVNQKDASGNTALHLICSNSRTAAGSKALAEVLLSNGANANATNNHLLTPIHFTSCPDEVAQILLTNGAKIDAADENGHTPLELAVSQGCVGRTDFLVRSSFLLFVR